MQALEKDYGQIHKVKIPDSWKLLLLGFIGLGVGIGIGIGIGIEYYSHASIPIPIPRPIETNPTYVFSIRL